ncbi:hypothetical protein NQ317_010869 [Molorchus minor]|uniref:Deoxynucleoside kinase domain-containing protein n=1 Tax=Molorchus minor TaxID=1323400 RepID=A0ABQ9K1E7_9CUCU|nr:hypothetical protein NQ317_010869 [Molorchus minor]
MASPVKSKPKRPYTVAVEGNIGSGKTTFLNYFNKHENVSIFTEPVELWRNCNGYNLLGLMYENPHEWSFTFQSYVQLTMLQQHCQRTHHPIKLMERSVYSASVIDEHFNWLTSYSDTSIDVIIYLRTMPELAYERIKQRNRSEEKCVPFEYLKEIHDFPRRLAIL